MVGVVVDVDVVSCTSVGATLRFFLSSELFTLGVFVPPELDTLMGPTSPVSVVSSFLSLSPGSSSVQGRITLQTIVTEVGP